MNELQIINNLLDLKVKHTGRDNTGQEDLFVRSVNSFVNTLITITQEGIRQEDDLLTPRFFRKYKLILKGCDHIEEACRSFNCNSPDMYFALIGLEIRLKPYVFKYRPQDNFVVLSIKYKNRLLSIQEFVYQLLELKRDGKHNYRAAIAALAIERRRDYEKYLSKLSMSLL